jgi:hypothetical protein
MRSITSALRVTAAAVTVTVLASGTADAAVTTSTKNTTMQVRVEFEGGFAPVEFLRTRTPAVLLVGDRLYSGGVVPAVYPGPAVSPIEERTVNRSAATRRARAVYDALRTPSGGWGQPPVADAPTVVVTATVDGRTRKASVPSLGIDAAGTGVTAEQSQAREKLRRALDALETLSGRGAMYRPRQLEAWVLTEYEIAGKGPQIGEEFISDPLAWPVGVPSRPGCNVMSAAKLPSGSNQASTYTVDGVKSFRAVFRPVLPGEKPCRRSVR